MAFIMTLSSPRHAETALSLEGFFCKALFGRLFLKNSFWKTLFGKLFLKNSFWKTLFEMLLHSPPNRLSGHGTPRHGMECWAETGFSWGKAILNWGRADLRS